MSVLRLSLAAAVAAGVSVFGSSGAWALTAVLTGAQQVGTAGDPDGFGTAAVEIVSPTTICFGHRRQQDRQAGRVPHPQRRQRHQRRRRDPVRPAEERQSRHRLRLHVRRQHGPAEQDQEKPDRLLRQRAHRTCSRRAPSAGSSSSPRLRKTVSGRLGALLLSRRNAPRPRQGKGRPSRGGPVLPTQPTSRSVYNLCVGLARRRARKRPPLARRPE